MKIAAIARARLAAAAAAMALALVIVCVPAGALAASLTPVTLRVDVFFYGAHVPLLLGIEDGIYRKHGLAVTALTGRGSATTIQTVANGSDDFGFADGGTLVKLAAQGLKAKQIVGMLEQTSIAILTLPGSGIKVPKDLDGKTGGFAPGSATDQIFPAFAEKAGIDLKSLKKIAVDVPTRDSMFLLKKTDFDIALTVAQLPILEQKCGCQLHVMRFADYGLNLMSNGIVVSDRLLAEKPGIVRSFAAATVESIALAVKNPGHAVDDFFKYAKGSGLSRNVVAEQWREAIPLLHSKATAHEPYGVMSDQDWQSTIDILTKYTKLPKGVVSPTMVYTNAFLPKPR